MRRPGTSLMVSRLIQDIFIRRKRPNVPLKKHIICSECGKHMTGYEVKKKHLWYYKCNTQGCRCNKSAVEMHKKYDDLLLGYEFAAEISRLQRNSSNQPSQTSRDILIACKLETSWRNGDFQDKQNIQLLAFPEGVMSISPKYVIGGPKARWRHQPPWRSVSETCRSKSKQRSHRPKHSGGRMPLGAVAKQRGLDGRSPLPAESEKPVGWTGFSCFRRPNGPEIEPYFLHFPYSVAVLSLRY